MSSIQQLLRVPLMLMHLLKNFLQSKNVWKINRGSLTDFNVDQKKQAMHKAHYVNVRVWHSYYIRIIATL